jgi:hypothetical protein
MVFSAKIVIANVSLVNHRVVNALNVYQTMFYHQKDNAHAQTANSIQISHVQWPTHDVT